MNASRPPVGRALLADRDDVAVAQSVALVLQPGEAWRARDLAIVLDVDGLARQLSAYAEPSASSQRVDAQGLGQGPSTHQLASGREAGIDLRAQPRDDVRSHIALVVLLALLDDALVGQLGADASDGQSRSVKQAMSRAGGTRRRS